MSGETLEYERRKAAPFVAEERARCAALAEAWGVPLVAQWIREGRKVVKHDASEFTYTVAEAGQQPETITADMPGIVLTQTMSREEAKKRWPSTPMPDDQTPEGVRIPGPEWAARMGHGRDGVPTVAPGLSGDTFAARWDARQVLPSESTGWNPMLAERSRCAAIARQWARSMRAIYEVSATGCADNIAADIEAGE